MGTNNLSTIGASIVKAVGNQLDQYFTALTGVIVPRKADGTPEDNTQDFGSPTFRWKDIYQSGAFQQPVFAKGGIFSFGNAKDGNYTVSTDGATMGGEYWFDTLTIDADITVDDTIGWLLIRANSVNVTKAGGATINGKGKSKCQVTAGSDGVATQETSGTTANVAYADNGSATGGSGGNGGNVDGTAGGTGNCLGFGFRGINGLSPFSSNANGPNGNIGDSSSFFWFTSVITTLTGAGSGSGGSGGSSSSTTGGNGGEGGKGGASVQFFCKSLVLSTNLIIDTRGNNGANGSAGNVAGGGGGGGGGGGNATVAYIAKTGASTLTLSVSGGSGGVGGANTRNGGNGGAGGDGLAIEYNLVTNLITIA